MTEPQKAAEVKRTLEEKKAKIERMYQRAMNLRDSTPCPDWPAANAAEMRYLAAYLKAYRRTRNVEAFKIATRQYRRFLREGKS